MRKIIAISLIIGLSVSIAVAQNITRQNISGPYNIQINTFTGNVFLNRTDMAINHPHLPLNFSFAYNSYKDSLNLGYGKGWSFPYSMCYAEVFGQSILIERPDGRKDVFRKSGNQYISPTGIFDELTEYESGKFKLEDKYGMAYYFDEPSHKKLTRITDLNGNTIQLSYNNNQISTITNAVGRTVQLSWSNGLLSSIRDSNGSFIRTVSYQYSSGRLTRITNPDNSIIQYEYDNDLGFLDKIIDELGNEYHIFYKRDGYAAQISSCFQTVRMVYDLEEFTTAVVEKSGNGQLISTYYYTEDGVLKNKTGNCCGFDQRYSYDRDYNVSGLTDANNNFFGSNYDAEGNMLKATDPFGFTQNYTYSGSYDRLAEMQDKRGNSFNFDYDADFNLTQIDGPESGEIGMTYDEKGNISSLTDGRLQTTLYQYDELDQLTQITYPDETVEQNNYDALGNLISTTDANNNSIYFEYDVFDRPVNIRDDLNNTVAYEYDAVGNMTKQVDANDNESNYEYDAHYRLTGVQTPEGGANYTYDAADNLTGITNANGNTWAKRYDKRGLMIAETDPLGNETRFEYDANGNMILKKEPNGNTVSYTYDRLNRLTSKTYLGNKDVYDYDENGNLIYCANNDIEISFAYDMENRLIEKEYVNWNKTISYTYDENGNRATLTDTDSGTTSYEYDELNRLTKVTNGFDVTTEFEYDEGGRLTQQSNYNGTFTTYTYDVADRLLSLENKQSDGTIISAFDYQYDNNGNRTAVTKASGETINYTYDGDNRLTNVEGDGSTENYTFDGAGNRMSLTKNGETTNYSYDEANRIQNAGTNSYTFDKNGNTKTKTDEVGTTIYEYDGENRLVKVFKSDGNIVEYRYDPFDNRLTRTTDNFQTETQYIIDGDNVLMELDETGNMQAHYTSTFQMDSWISMNRENENYIYHKDGLGSTDAMTNTSGSIINTYQYDSYGNIENQTMSIDNPYTYTGREWDTDVDMYYYRSRYYDAEQGRFITKDLFEGFIDSPLSLNQFAYAEGNPVNYIDPDGEFAFLLPFAFSFAVRGALAGAVYSFLENLAVQSINNARFRCNQFDYGSLLKSTFTGGAYGATGLGFAKDFAKFRKYANKIRKQDKKINKANNKISKGLAKNGNFHGSKKHNKLENKVAKHTRKRTKHYMRKSKYGYNTILGAAHELKGIYGNIKDLILDPKNNCDKEKSGFQEKAEEYVEVLGDVVSNVVINIIRAIDPNEVQGPTGVGLEKWVPYNKPSAYTIYFENDPDLATAPAQKVVIYFPFDEPVNPYSFRVGSFNFGNLNFEVPKGLSFYNERLAVKDSVGVNVQFTTGIDLDNNRAYWILESLDPQSGLSSTLKANEGFLPVNDTISRKGEGYVNFTIEPYPIDPLTMEMVETGTIINAEAEIIFDTELPISTPPIFNTIDADHPESEIEQVINVGSGTYQINWSGNDFGSGFAAVDLLISENDRPFVPTLVNINESPIIFNGNTGSTYTFLTNGIDSVGLRELDQNEPVEPTSMPGCTDVCAPNYNPDATEDDGSCEVYDMTCNSDCLLGDIEVWDAATCSCIVNMITIKGCTNVYACNYYPSANCDDGSCDIGNSTCSDPCNPPYTDDGCDLTTDIFDAATCTVVNIPNCPPETYFDDVNCYCIELYVFGCTDPCSVNYDPNANMNDGSCIEFDCNDNNDCTMDYQDGATCDCINELIENCEEVCNNKSGLMQRAKSFVCEGDFIVLKEANSSLDENSVTAYVLHEGIVFDGSNYLEINQTGRFESPGIEYNNQSLYVSAVIGPPDGEGYPLLNDSCTVWTPYGARVIFLEAITVNIIEERCEEELYFVDLTIEGGLSGVSSNRVYKKVTDGTTTYTNVSKDEILTYGPYPYGDSYTIAVDGAKGCAGNWIVSHTCEATYRIRSYQFSDSEILLLDNYGSDVVIQEILVFNANGQQVQAEIEKRAMQCTIELNQAGKGVYFAQVILSNGEMAFVKLLKQ